MGQSTECKVRIVDSYIMVTSTYATFPLNPQLFPDVLKIESPIIVAAYSSFPNVIPVEAIRIKTHQHHFGMTTDWFRHGGILLAFRGWCINTIPQMLPRLSDWRLSLIISARQTLSHCSNRHICLINYTHKAIGNVTFVCC